MNRWTRVCVIACALALPACGSKKTAVTAPPLPPPPVVSQVAPAPRSVGVTNVAPEIWAEFTEPLDPSTVNVHNVYLKVDDARVAITVSYDATRRRVVIQPQAPLGLFVVYTAELSTNIRTAAGGAFPRTWFWQFTTISIRRPSDPSPPTGSSEHSPFVLLGWGGIGNTPGTAQFQVYAGPDSVAVAARSAPPIAVTSKVFWYPRIRWAENAVTYWSVRATNLSTGEYLDSPVWSFRTLDPATYSLQSVTLTAIANGWQLRTNRNSRSCAGNFISCGPAYYTAIRWDLSLLPLDVRVAGVDMLLTVTPGGESSLPGGLAASGTINPIDTCNLFDVPPVIDGAGVLAGVASVAGGTATIRSDGLAAHLEADRRYPGFEGYRITSSATFSLQSLGGADPTARPRLVVTYYTR